MQLSLALPVGVPGVSDENLVEWARVADRSGFHALAVTGRTPSFAGNALDALTTASAIAPGLSLVVPVFLGASIADPDPIATPIGALQKASGGQVRIAIIQRELGEDDFRDSGVDSFERRATFVALLDAFEKVWGAQGLDAYPPYFFSGRSQATAHRLSTRGTGWFAPLVNTIDNLRSSISALEYEWKSEARSGSPTLVAIARFALGTDAAGLASADSARFAEAHGGSTKNDGPVSTSAAEIDALCGALGPLGCDEVIFEPCDYEISQVEMLAGALSGALVAR